MKAFPLHDDMGRRIDSGDNFLSGGGSRQDRQRSRAQRIEASLLEL
jgi:hypothetical protein